jgi:putative SOS response-associated peptidase YedK
MCGRYTLTNSQQLALRFDVASVPPVEATFNAAPSTPLPVIVEQDGQRTAQLMRWGLVPHWAKDPHIGFKMINARAETVAEKPSYRTSLRRQRCLVPARGFYEWRKDGNAKLPYYIHLRDDSLFAFAGLYDTWQDEGEPLRTFTIITTKPNGLVEPIHDRMPAILHKDEEALWLDPEVQDTGLLTALLRPYPDDEMEAYQVSTRVNSPANNDPTVLAPV